MSIIVAGSVFVDIKGHPEGAYIPDGRNAGRIEQVGNSDIHCIITPTVARKV